MLTRVSVNWAIPVLGKLLDGPHMIEMTVREHDCRGTRLGCEPGSSRAHDQPRGAGNSGIDQNPFTVPCPLFPPEYDVHHGKSFVRQVWNQFMRATVAILSGAGFCDPRGRIYWNLFFHNKTKSKIRPSGGADLVKI